MKIGPFNLEKFSFYGDFWSTRHPAEQFHEKSEPYCTIEKQDGSWKLTIMGGIWCETCHFEARGTFRGVIAKARKFLSDKFYYQLKLDSLVSHV